MEVAVGTGGGGGPWPGAHRFPQQRAPLSPAPLALTLISASLALSCQRFGPPESELISLAPTSPEEDWQIPPIKQLAAKQPAHMVGIWQFSLKTFELGEDISQERGCWSDQATGDPMPP